MSSDYLKYTDLLIEQDDTLFKYNTDTSVLGMSFDPMYGKSVLDIGCNTGALLLYAFHKGAKRLLGVDISHKALSLAERNISRYTPDFALYECPVQELDGIQADVIVCNPPFFEMNNVTPDEERRKALFESSLPPEELFQAFRRLLKDNGEIWFIYPADRFPEIYQLCLRYKLKIMKLRFVHDENSLYALRTVYKLKIGKMTKLNVLSPVIVRDGEFTL